MIDYHENVENIEKALNGNEEFNFNDERMGTLQQNRIEDVLMWKKKFTIYSFKKIVSSEFLSLLSYGLIQQQ